MPENKGSIDPAALQILEKAQAEHISTCFSRVHEMQACPIGKNGGCCRTCFMGPCRFTSQKNSPKVGICGATTDTVVARNLTRSIAAGCAAHAAHGHDLALTLLAVASETAKDFQIKDKVKLHALAQQLGIQTEGRTEKAIALKVAEAALNCFGQQNGELDFLRRAPEKRHERWRALNITPRGIHQEIVETVHQTSMGVNQDPERILTQALRVSLADGWGGSMLATELSDILFGTPRPRLAKTNLGVLKEDKVNVVVHGHKPTLAEAIVAAVSDRELLKLAQAKGAKGINLVGICCTSNEILMRHGISPAGNFLHQELAILTGAVDAMVVDIQCVLQALSPLTDRFHTKLITTSPQAMIEGATHIEFDEKEASKTAKTIIKMAVENFPNRKEVFVPQITSDLVAGFSHEYIKYMLGGKYRASFRPLNDAIITGCVQGIAAVVGCNNPRVCQDEAHNHIVRELIRSNILVVQTGCGALANAKYGLMTPEALSEAGPFLREVCKAVGIPPVIHLGSCVDNSRILTILTEIVNEGGLGEDLSDLPVAAVVPEWMSEKALSIGA
ncbi:MAG: anaerobic carbon-monoxide dehydrogenase catalytic subunit [Actinomycetota bacterium]